MEIVEHAMLECNRAKQNLENGPSTVRWSPGTARKLHEVVDNNCQIQVGRKQTLGLNIKYLMAHLEEQN